MFKVGDMVGFAFPKCTHVIGIVKDVQGRWLIVMKSDFTTVNVLEEQACVIASAEAGDGETHT